MAKFSWKRFFQPFLFPAVVYFFQLMAQIFFQVYEVFPDFDIPMHFLGGVSIGITVCLLLEYFTELKLIEIRHFALFVIYQVSLVVCVAVLWEFHEFLVDQIFGTNIQVGIPDTMFDLFLGMLGGLTSALVFWRFSRKK